ncbi:MAG: NYN domain-containing protein [Gemmatimonadales bacterium]|nr:MAG: NYN domain-containing protein [Gemmatimonadales bacterium]
MNIPYIRAPHTEGVSHPVLPSNSPNAALLIDFDNVTMGMRSDLSKELKTLLQSDVIRGKVTVQRAYADWRRYPQYIVPLSEASVDLIFAPAYGSSKKNATDIRMAIDGMELVFTRPEIGTYILLTGDSDFSSLVLKLKEYGKYVIGVGIQESSSDILVQNCDEYYSYTTLSGLRKAGTGEALSQQDPWTLVQRAVEQMTKRRDVMRSDRLKQVMLDLDSTFDEKAIGFSKFSRFLTEAAQKGLIELKKMENGQYEVSNGRSSAAGASSPSPSSGSSTPARRDRDGRDSRGSRGRDRDAPRRDRAESTDVPAPEGAQATSAPETSPAEAAAAPAGTAEASPTPSTAGTDGSGTQNERLRAAYELMVRAIRDLADAEGDAVRDSDVKRRMLAIQENFDESELGFGKFSLFLKQADEHEVIELTRGDNGIYEVRVRKGADALPATDAAASAPARDGDRDRAREAPKERAAAPTPDASEGSDGRRLRPRLSARRRGASDEPPPFLEGQAVSVPGAPAPKQAEAASSPADEAEGREESEGQQEKAPTRRGRPPRGRGQKAGAEAGDSQEAAAEKPSRGGRGKAKDAPPAGKPAGRASGKPAEKGAAKTSARPASDLPQLGLPSDAESIRQYLMNSYKGVGQKTADTLVEAHEDNLFEVMESQPDMIRSLLPAARAEKLLEQWVDDVARRRAEAHGPAGRPAPEATPRRRSTGGGRRRGSGGRPSR